MLAALVFTTNRARAEDASAPLGWLPGAARAVPRSSSASRDTPVFEYAHGPRAQGSLGGEIDLFGARGRSVSFRLGGYAMIALENTTETQPFPREHWSGLIGLSGSLSLDALTFATRGQLNFASLDAAVRVPIGGRGRAEIRLTERLFVGSIFTHAPSFDLDLRWRASTWLQPTVAAAVKADEAPGRGDILRSASALFSRRSERDRALQIFA